MKTGGDDVVGRAIAVRTKARELGVLGDEVVAMVQHVIATHGDAVNGSELDPAQLRGKRDKLIAKAEELLPKIKPAVDGTVDLAAQLKQAMQKNAFGDLRFSGRDPVEVIDELKQSWAEIGPILDEADRAQVARFEDVVAQVLDAAGAKARTEREDERAERSQGDRERRRRGERQAHQPPIGSQAPRSTEPAAIAEVVATQTAVPQMSPITSIPDAAASAVSAIATSDEITANESIPMSMHDAVTQPAHLPPELPIGELPRAKAVSTVPPMDDVDTGWDMGDDDPTATSATSSTENETDNAPSSTEMASDGGVEGDGLDQVD